MPEQPTPSPNTERTPRAQQDTQATLTRRRFVRLGWITAVLVAVGGQLWVLLKLFFAPPYQTNVRTKSVPWTISQNAR